MNLKNFKLIIFDLDGTLVNSAKDIMIANNKTLVKFGYKPISFKNVKHIICLLYTSPSPRDGLLSRMPSSA